MEILVKNKSTKIRLLDAAESLFADKGISGTSLRNIIAEAGTNIASVHYHFGSKEELIKEVYSRRMKPIIEERKKLLDEIDFLQDKDQVLENVIIAFIKPILSIHQGVNKDKKILLKLLEKTFSEKDDFKKIIISNSDNINRIFLQKFQDLFPELHKIELIWRFKFIFGVVLSSARLFPDSSIFEIKNFDKMDVQFHLDRIVPFLVAGFNAPVVKNSLREKETNEI